MKKIGLLLLLFLSLNIYAEGIDAVGANVAILPSSYYSHASYSAQTYTLVGQYCQWGEEVEPSGVPPTDKRGRQWYEVGYNLTNNDIKWEEHTSPFSSSENWEGMPAFCWTTDNVSADIYFRRSFTLNEPLPSAVYLACGHDDGCSEFYINGVKVVQTDTHWDNSEYQKLTDAQKALIKTDGTENIIAVHVHNNFGGAFADCGLYGVEGDNGSLPMGYNEKWTARVLFNSEGGYNYQSNNIENEIHGWEKLYEACEGDIYTITLPTPALEGNNARVQFKTPITIDASHSYSFKLSLTTSKIINNVVISLRENEDDGKLLGSKTVSLNTREATVVSMTGLTGVDIQDLKVDFAFPSSEENTVITLSKITLYDTTAGKELWTGTSYFNYMYYFDPTINSRIKDMTIDGRVETNSWQQPDFDDSMWTEALMPVGSEGYGGIDLGTLWPGGDNTNYWIRRNFDLKEVKGTTAYILNVCHDDAYSIYVNGHLIDSAIGWTNGTEYESFEIPSRYLKVGKNVIATYIQQNWGGKFFDCGMTVKENAYEDYDVDADRTTSLIATEVEVANIDQIIDYSYNYGAWVELYNKSDKRITLDYLYLSDDANNLQKFMLPANSGVIQPHEYRCIFFDHNATDGVYGDNAYKQVSFDLQTEGGTLYISEDGKTPFITVTYPESVTRCSYARKSIDSDEWGMNGKPTPNGANSDNFATKRLAAPVIDTDSKLFDSGFIFNVVIPEGATLRYTTDGTAPTWDNGEISTNGQFQVNETSNYRFRLFQEGYLPSQVVTRSFIYRDNEYYLPVISITTNPDNLYDSMIGVYVDGENGVSGRNHGKSNLNMDWERPVNFEYITADNKMGLNMEAEFTIAGGWSRHFAPAAFKIKATKVYEGLKSLDFPFFPCKPYNRYKQILIRNGGNDNDSQEHGRVRDAITQETLISSGFYVDAQDYQPVHVFFNGKYIGQLNLREPNNRYNGTANYGYDNDEMDAFEYSNGYYQMAGTKDAFNKWHQTAKEVAMGSKPYSALREIVDMNEYTNYWAAVTYIGCSDWICNNNNVKGYRSLPDGKFHITMLDQDWGWSNFDAVQHLEGNYGNELLQIYNYTKSAPEFQRQFVDSYCILNGSVFTPERCLAIGDSICNLVAPALAFEGKQPWTSWNEQRDRMISENARETRMQALRNCYNLGQGMEVSFRSNISNAAFRINEQPVPTNKFDGTLFAPVAIEVSAPSGYTFAGWKAVSHYEIMPFAFGSDWYYYDQGSLDGVATWTRGKTDGWEHGKAPLGYGKDNIATIIDYGGDSANKYPTYYFRKDFTLDRSLTENDAVKLNFVADDGFVLYVNGREAARYNMPEGEIAFNTFAPTYADGNPDRGTLTLDANLFREGTNRLAVEVHNNVAGSSDIYWDAEIGIVSSSNDDIVSMDRTLVLNDDKDMDLEAIFEPLPDKYLAVAGQTPVVINEVSAANTIFVNDYYKKNDWIELYNTTNKPIDVAGMYLSDDPDKPRKYQIPSTTTENSVNSVIPAHGYLVVWADKLDPLYQLHTSFKLGNEDGQCVILTAADGTWADTLTYIVHTGEESVGRYPDGGSRVYKMTKPTINAQNTLTSYAEWISGENEDFDINKYISGLEDQTIDKCNIRTEFFSVDGVRLGGIRRGVTIVRTTDSAGNVTTKKIIDK